MAAALEDDVSAHQSTIVMASYNTNNAFDCYTHPADTVTEPDHEWTVHSYLYYTAYDGQFDSKPSMIFLASDKTGHHRSIQFWSYSRLTNFHGEWMTSIHDSALTLKFNCRGPRYEDGSLRNLRTTHLFREPIQDFFFNNPCYYGQDYAGRLVCMSPDQSWKCDNVL